MSRDRSSNKSRSHGRSREFPYRCNSSKAEKSSRSKTPLPSSGGDDEKEWEEARCPACMESPQNAVLLLCSSHHKGCRPYLRDTSHRHSNCLDQFRKSSEKAAAVDENGVSNSNVKLTYPLCRGDINGWVVNQRSRDFMNSKQRSCSLETCDFTGSYSQLRKHARLEHPSVRPSDADPQRQQEWEEMVRQNELRDLQSAANQMGTPLLCLCI